MLKTVLTASILSLSLSSFAAVELRSVVNAESCTIKNGEVTKTTSMLKGEVKFSTTNKVTIEGLDALADKVVATTTGTANEFFTHELIVDGETYVLNSSDSEHSMALINMMSRICKTF